VVGDRLDTDIEGAVRAGMESLLVLTGVTTPTQLLQAPPSARPSYVAADLGGLFDPTQVARLPVDDPSRPGPAAGAGATPPPTPAAENGWRVEVDGTAAVLTGAGSSVEALRVLCTAAWSGRPITSVLPGSAAARTVLGNLDLPR
jgi:glycerol-1-phosphatase